MRVGGHELPAPDDAASGSVDYVVRPEKLRFVGAGEAVLSGTIEARAFLGNYWLFQVATDIGPVQLTLPNMGLPQADEGDAVGLAWSPDHARVLPRGDGAQPMSPKGRPRANCSLPEGRRAAPRVHQRARRRAPRRTGSPRRRRW